MFTNFAIRFQDLVVFTNLAILFQDLVNIGVSTRTREYQNQRVPESTKSCARAGALPPAGRNPQILHFLRIFKSDFSRVFEPWAECSLFWVKLKKTRTEIPYRIPVESYSNLKYGPIFFKKG